MTEQERFESWFSTNPDFKVLADMFGNPFSRKADGSYWLSVVRTASDAWQAAQQKESVDIDADQLSNFIRKIDGNNSMGAGALAEHIVGWLKTKGYPQQKEGYVLVPVEREKL